MNKLSGVLLSFEKGAATKEVCRTLHNILEAKQNQFKGLEGMHTWTLDFSDKNEMYVHFHGIVPETCISVSLRVKSSAAVACKAELTRTQRYKSGRLLTRFKIGSEVLHFVESRIMKLCHNISMDISNIGAIGKIITQLEWEHCRTEMITKEIVQLQARFKTGLQQDSENRQKFLLAVDISDYKRSIILTSNFELVDSYPFTPLQVCLTLVVGDMNLDILSKQLIKNVQPGFGYLTRACDVIQAYLR